MNITQDTKVIGFIYPFARAAGWSELVEKPVENSRPPLFQSTFKRGTVTVSILTDEAGAVQDVARINQATDAISLWGDEAEGFEAAVYWLAGGGA